jgi:hypothetical protein
VDRPSDHALWTAVIETLRSAVRPHVDEPFAALQTDRLIGLATYARDRRPDPTDERRAAVTGLVGGDDPAAVLLDPTDSRAPALRRLLVRHLDADLEDEAVLLEHFDPAHDRRRSDDT